MYATCAVRIFLSYLIYNKSPSITFLNIQFFLLTDKHTAPHILRNIL